MSLPRAQPGAEGVGMCGLSSAARHSSPYKRGALSVALPQRRDWASKEGQVAAVALTMRDMYLQAHVGAGRFIAVSDGGQSASAQGGDYDLWPPSLAC